MFSNWLVILQTSGAGHVNHLFIRGHRRDIYTSSSAPYDISFALSSFILIETDRDFVSRSWNRSFKDAGCMIRGSKVLQWSRPLQKNTLILHSKTFFQLVRLFSFNIQPSNSNIYEVRNFHGRKRDTVMCNHLHETRNAKVHRRCMMLKI